MFLHVLDPPRSQYNTLYFLAHNPFYFSNIFYNVLDIYSTSHKFNPIVLDILSN